MSVGDWTPARLSDVAVFSSGTTPSRSRQSEYFDLGTHLWVKTLDLNNSRIVSTDERVTDRAIAETSLKIFPAGTVLIALYGGFRQIGSTGLFTRPAAANQAITTMHTDRRKLTPEYLLHILNFFVDYWRTVASSSRKDPNITGGDVKNFSLLLPPIHEQMAIAEAINDVDELIRALDQLVRKKMTIGQGMMQELLTGTTRLPGFEGPWSRVQLSKLLDFKNGLNKGSEFFGAGTPIVNFMDVMRNPVTRVEQLRGRVTVTQDEIRRFSARRGDLFFTRTSETVEEVGTTTVLVDDVPDAVFSGFVLRGRSTSSQMDPRFLSRLMGLESVRRQIISSASYTTRALTNGRSLGRVEVAVPRVEEQAAIAAVLDNVDSESAALSSRLTKAKAVKHGMMQELLTGRTRLPAAELSS